MSAAVSGSSGGGGRRPGGSGPPRGPPRGGGGGGGGGGSKKYKLKNKMKKNDAKASNKNNRLKKPGLSLMNLPDDRPCIGCGRKGIPKGKRAHERRLRVTLKKRLDRAAGGVGDTAALLRAQRSAKKKEKQDKAKKGGKKGGKKG